MVIDNVDGKQMRRYLIYDIMHLDNTSLSAYPFEVRALAEQVAPNSGEVYLLSNNMKLASARRCPLARCMRLCTYCARQ
jgi:hypothetical protein